MAYKDKIISNPVTNQIIRFIQTAKDTQGEFLEMESTYNSYSKEPVQHYHPFQEERFTVITGEVTIRINGQLKILKQGESLHIPANAAHSMWNNTPGKTVVNWKVVPAMNTEYLLETGMGLSQDGKVNNAGMPNLMQVALLANKFSGVYRLAKPPFFVQQILFFLIAPVSYLLGYRAVYRKYLD